MNENYQFKGERLTLSDPSLGISIDEPFSPPLIPKNFAPEEGLVVSRGHAGEVVSAYFEKEGKFEGQYHLYYPGGKLEMECFYLSGLLHGPSRFYSTSGECLSETWFIKDQKEGKASSYYLSGQMCALERFKGGVMHGAQEYFYEDGSVKSILPYQEGRIEGEVTLFWPSGKKKRRLAFKGGVQSGQDHMWSSSGEEMETPHAHT